MQQISAGRRPIIPASTPKVLATLIEMCWAADPMARPSFQEASEALKKAFAMDFSDKSLDVGAKIGLDETINEPAEAFQQDEEKGYPWMLDYDELELEEVIGKGKFGEVWLGSFRGKKVAIKKLNFERLSRQFINELAVMSSLRHPNTLLLIGACVKEPNLALVTEYCEKGNLFELLHDSAQLIDYNHILKISVSVAEGCAYLHGNSPPILHRDLKSLNILVDSDWNVKVSDFGLTRFQGTKSSFSKPDAFGTPFWLAPEVMENQRFVEGSDVYSFGMILWELFTRKIPFTNMNPHQAAIAVITEDVRPEIPKYVPPRFQELIRKCWQRDPNKRPSFVQIVKTLGELKAEGLPRIDLSMKNAKLYQKNSSVYAFQSRDVVIVQKPWGVGEAKPMDFVLVGPEDDVYTCDLKVFKKTYTSIPGVPQLFRKTGKIFAKEMDCDFLIETMEGMEHGQEGDFIAQNPVHGEQWPISRSIFMKMYELADQILGEKIESTKSPGLGLPRDSFKERQSEKSQPIYEVSSSRRLNSTSFRNASDGSIEGSTGKKKEKRLSGIHVITLSKQNKFPSGLSELDSDTASRKHSGELGGPPGILLNTPIILTKGD